MSVNRVILVGNVGRDPELRSPAGKQVANFSLATSRRWRDKASGERREATEWHRVVVYNENLVKTIAQYVHKGSKLYVEGELNTRKYTDRAGIDRTVTEVVLRDFAGQLVLLDRAESPPPDDKPDDYGRPKSGAMAPGPGGEDVPYNDEIPF